VRRRFIVLADTLDEMQRAAPLLARCVSAALMISHGLRTDADLLFHSLKDGFTMHFVADRLRGVRPDEASVLGIITKAFRAACTVGDRPRSVHSGVLICKRSLNAFLAQFSAKYLCSSRGLDLRYVQTSYRDLLFIVPLHHEPHIEGVALLRCFTDVLLPDQVISLLNLYLDRCCV